jgi:transcriptional regulator with XRE-family HTH domain
MAMKRLTHEFVAEKAGISTATLRNWARGRTTPRLIDIEAVVNVLGSDLSVKKSASED